MSKVECQCCKEMMVPKDHQRSRLHQRYARRRRQSRVIGMPLLPVTKMDAD